MPKVFINYRRDDARAEAGRISDFIEGRFWKGFVFQDVEDLQPGERWQKALKKAGKEAKVVLAVIGPDWLQKDDSGKSRLNDPEDWVRKELELAIEQGKTIIPVLVNEGALPEKTEIPESIHALFNHQAIGIRTDSWNHDIKRIIPPIMKKTRRLPKRYLYYFAGLLVFATLLVIGSQVTEKPPPGNGKDPNGTSTTDPNASQPGRSAAQKFCPDFVSNSDIKVLLFPFSREADATDNSEDIIKTRISNICSEYAVTPDTKKANTQEYMDKHDAKAKCPNCLNDLFVTGITLDEGDGSNFMQVEFGFCNPLMPGVSLNEDLLEISLSNYSLASLFTNQDLNNSLDHIIRILAGIYLAKKGETEASNKVLEEVIDLVPDGPIKREALKVKWQNDYKLGKMEDCITSLEAMQKITATPKLIATKAIIQEEVKQYDASINSLNLVIAQTADQNLKEKYTVKRADVYVKNEDYQAAKKDYESVKQTEETRTKLVKVNDQIRANNLVVDRSGSNVNSLSDSRKMELLQAYMRTGNIDKAKELGGTIDFSKINSKDAVIFNQRYTDVLRNNQSFRKLKSTVQPNIKRENPG